MKRAYHFLRELAANNNREWFSAHKTDYLEAKEEADALTRRLIAAVAAVDPDAAALGVSDCTYRIYRDTRFSPDKTPYKTHFGIYVNPPAGKKSYFFGYYFHIQPEGSFMAAGNICLPSPLIKALRQSIFDEIDEYRSIVEDPAFRQFFPAVGENLLKTAPKGFPKDWEHIAYLRPRDFVTTWACGDVPFLSDSPVDALMPAIRQAWRFNRFFNFTIEDYQ